MGLRRIVTIRVAWSILGYSQLSPAQSPRPASATAIVGPLRGALVVAGGGELGSEIIGRFIELAGGPHALIVVIPTAGGDSSGKYGRDCSCSELLRKNGATILR